MKTIIDNVAMREYNQVSQSTLNEKSLQSRSRAVLEGCDCYGDCDDGDCGADDCDCPSDCDND